MTRQMLLISLGAVLMPAASALVSFPMLFLGSDDLAAWMYQIGVILLTAGLAAWAINWTSIQEVKQEIRQLKRELDFRRSIDIDDDDFSSTKIRSTR